MQEKLSQQKSQLSYLIILTLKDLRWLEAPAVEKYWEAFENALMIFQTYPTPFLSLCARASIDPLDFIVGEIKPEAFLACWKHCEGYAEVEVLERLEELNEVYHPDAIADAALAAEKAAAAMDPVEGELLLFMMSRDGADTMASVLCKMVDMLGDTTMPRPAPKQPESGFKIRYRVMRKPSERDRMFADGIRAYPHGDGRGVTFLIALQPMVAEAGADHSEDASEPGAAAVFGAILEAQEAQLEANPTLEGFEEHRGC